MTRETSEKSSSEKSRQDNQIPGIFRAPASFAQKRLWFLDQLEPGLNVYNIPLTVHLYGNLNHVSLQRSLSWLVERHEVLRTTFEMHSGQPIQCIASAMEIPVRLADMSGEPVEQRAILARNLMQEEAQRPFDLQQGPLIRALLIQLAPQEHLFVLTQHHIITDGWSTGIILQEVAAGYEAAEQGQILQLPVLPIQYADYAAWQQQVVKQQGAKLRKQQTYWKQQLAGAPTVLELLTERVRPALQLHHGIRLHQPLPRALWQEVRALSQREGVTPFMLMLSAFGVLLSRMSEQQDLLIGTAIAGRQRRELEALIGFFANTLPLRLDLTGHPSGRQLLQRVREMTLQAYAHQDLPFEQIVEMMQPERSLGRNPLVQVFFTLDTMPGQLPSLGDVALSIVDNFAQSAHFDLVIIATEIDEDCRLTLEYDTDLFSAASMQEFLAHYQIMLEGLVQHLEMPVAQLPWLSEAERVHVLSERNATQVPYPQNATIAELFAQQARQRPDALALCCDNEQMSYEQLDQRSTQLGHYLQACGVGPDTLVGISLERSVELVIGLLGILKAGGAYVPLDPGYPADRLAYLLEDTGLSLLLTRQQIQEHLPAFSGRILCLDHLWPEIAQESTQPCLNHTGPDNLAFVIYTSGSTGQPKGVQGTQQNVSRLLFGETYIHLDENETLIHMAPTAFDASTFEIWGALVHGGHCVLSTEHLPTPTRLGTLLAEQGVSTLWLTSSLLNAIIDEAPETLRGVRQLFTGGEVLSISHIRKAQEVLKETQISNGYGPTETTTFAACHRLPRPLDASWQTIPLGTAIGNTQIYILDSWGEPVPVGVPGEIYIGGPGVSRGYLRRPALTAERFVPDPFSRQVGGRLYRTGDQARYLHNGMIDFLGRFDHQVKLRGYRIELGEIESVLRTQAGVQDAIVVLGEVVAGQKILIAYIISLPEQSVSDLALREQLRKVLPAYMIPSFFQFLSAFPLTPNGKLDRRALAARSLVYEQPTDFLLPQTDTQKILATLWEQVFAQGPIGQESNFFEAGGHSLLLMSLLTRVRETFQVEIAVQAFFSVSTLVDQAALIDQAQKISTQVRLPELKPIARSQDLPLSFAQQRLWFLQQLEPDKTTYTVPLLLRLDGVVKPEAVQYSLKEIIRRHEVLRTTFHERAGQPFQVIAESLEDFSVTSLDWQAYSVQQQEEQRVHLVREEIQRPFDLQRGPLLRATLIQLQSEQSFFLLCMHHVVFDGWSLDVFSHEFTACYRAYCEQRSPDLSTLSIQYADYAYWQREWLQGAVLEQFMQYWKRQLVNLPPLLSLPLDRERSQVMGKLGQGYPWRATAELTAELRRRSKEAEVTLFMYVVAVFALALYGYSKQEDLIIGTNVANRSHPGVEGLIGFFVNQIVLRVQVKEDFSFTDVLQAARKVILDAYAYQDLPFDLLIQSLTPQRHDRLASLSQVKINFQMAPGQHDVLPGLDVHYEYVEMGTSEHDITLSFIEHALELECIWLYNPDLFDQTTIAAMVSFYESLLSLTLSRPDERAGTLIRLAETEQVKQKMKRRVSRSAGKLSGLLKEKRDLSEQERKIER